MITITLTPEENEVLANLMVARMEWINQQPEKEQYRKEVLLIGEMVKRLLAETRVMIDKFLSDVN